MAPDGAKKRKGGERENNSGSKQNKQGLGSRQREKGNSPALLAENKLFFADAGTAAGLLLASDADLFEAVFSTGGKDGLGLERRVLTFPSGELGEGDLDLFVGGGLGGGLGLPVR